MIVENGYVSRGGYDNSFGFRFGVEATLGPVNRYFDVDASEAQPTAPEAQYVNAPQICKQ